MLNVEEALEQILAVLEPLPITNISILEADGMVLAKNIISQIDIPPLDNSAMDGYAVKSDNVQNASPSLPIALRVVGTTAAGQLPFQSLVDGHSVRIMTGAPIPLGSDAVIPFEETSDNSNELNVTSNNEVLILHPAFQGKNIRQAGQDVRKGDKVITAGTVLRPAHIALIASLGKSKVAVHRPPVVAVLATGDEITKPGHQLTKGMIYDSNSYGIASSIKEAGGKPVVVGIARDNVDSIERKLFEIKDCDLIITSAGVSKGDFDIVKNVLKKNGAIQFHSVRMKPGKPLAFGLLEQKNSSVPLIGLPGNPVSALVAFEQFCRPAIRLMSGHKLIARTTINAVLDDTIDNPDGRRVYARVHAYKKKDVYHASLTGEQSSNILSAMGKANGLAICPENKTSINAGEDVTVMMLYWNAEVF